MGGVPHRYDNFDGGTSRKVASAIEAAYLTDKRGRPTLRAMGEAEGLPPGREVRKVIVTR